MSVRLAAVRAGLLVIGAALPLSARQAPTGESERVREAERYEAAGDIARAAGLLEEVLGDSPGSVPALLALERVLRVQGRMERLPARAEALVRADPASAAIGYQVLVRAYDALGDEAALEQAGDRWIQLNPRIETPYRELAEVWAGRNRPERAIEMLERGRAALPAGDALALELGEAYARAGDPGAAAREWSRAVGPEARGLRLVRRRLAGLPDAGAAAAPHLIEALAADDSAAARQRAAVELAIDAGLERQVLDLAPRVAAALGGRELETFLGEVARRADGAGMHGAAYWAYSELLREADGDDRSLALRGRAAELALAAGDTAAAHEHLAVVEGSAGAGAEERRQAAARRIELSARTGQLERALADLETFRARHPDAPELDRVAAALAGLVLADGDDVAAERVLEGADGPKSSVVRARLALRRGQVADARAAFLAAAPSLHGAEATEVLNLATVLGRVSADGGQLLGRAMLGIGAGELEQALGELFNGAGALPDAEAAVVLEFAATLADRHGMAGEAERLRRRLIAEYPDARETPAAMLALARGLLQRPDAAEEARALLERLVVDHPRSALAPQARRELEALGRRH